MSHSELTCDVMVIGAGPAGSVLSLLLGRLGYSVELYEKDHFPREKPCGEGLLPPGAELLFELGLSKAVGGTALNGLRYHIGEDSVYTDFGCDAQGRLRYGLGQKRLIMDERLWNAAKSTSGVVAQQGIAVSKPWIQDGRVRGMWVNGERRGARLVVAADGSCSAIRRKLGIEQLLRPGRVGIRVHYTRKNGSPIQDIQVFLRRGYELYVTPLPGNELLVAALAHDEPGRNLRRQFTTWLHSETEVMRLLEGAIQSSELMGRAPLLKKARHAPIPSGLIFLGDASQSVDPVTAGGMTLALESAATLAQHMKGILRGDAQALSSFTRARERRTRVHQWLGAGLRTLSQVPLAARCAKGLIDLHPETMSALVSLTTTRSVA